MAIRPETMPARAQDVLLRATWLALRFGKRFSMAVLVEPSVTTELIR
jgi:hypothetical protein